MSNFESLIEKYTDNRLCLVLGLIDNGPLRIPCPYCSSFDVTDAECSCTLIGSLGGPDPNHFTCVAGCRKCRKKFGYEHKVYNGYEPNVFYTNVWYRNAEDWKSGIVIKGIHNCCGGKYIHKYCGGLIKEVRTKLDGITLTNSMSWGPNGKSYREFIKCDGCDLYEEII